jgi:group I intron endonuclease
LLKQKKIRTNKENGKTYIGSSVNLGRRLSEYFSEKFLQKELEKNGSIIYKALLKYGYSKFSFEIIEYCEPSDVIKREQDNIDLLQPEYNICKTAGSSFGREVSDETRAKLQAS